MYEELVKNLRECWDDSEANVCDCDKCMFKDKIVKQDGWADYSECEKAMCLAAADAIEKLSAYTELYKDLAEKNQQMARKLIEEKPRWIPVTERLPEEWWPVLGLIKFHKKKEPPAQQVLWYLGNGHWREVWRGDMIENDVTHWLPLPELPKEDGE